MWEVNHGVNRSERTVYKMFGDINTEVYHISIDLFFYFSVAGAVSQRSSCGFVHLSMFIRERLDDGRSSGRLALGGNDELPHSPVVFRFRVGSNTRV